MADEAKNNVDVQVRKVKKKKTHQVGNKNQVKSACFLDEDDEEDEVSTQWFSLLLFWFRQVQVKPLPGSRRYDALMTDESVSLWTIKHHEFTGKGHKRDG
ncbi:hypothetical protein F2P81_015777 [Scophthalmus maximus]|uniref:Uncharacterized protein n=1 Tax=Scophthalmus maximus TaxID=52904 RepID=A0A6A4SLN1_SCOMX|nr:hypothetical protein F2P81_015777 [Scophthalmus maximus]